MKKNIFIIIIFAVFLLGCNKETPVAVVYQASGAISSVTLNYTGADGNLQTVTINPQSAQDVWKTSFNAEQGDIVYLSGKYSDANSALKLLIKVDGKVYKQASNEGDTLKYLTISGVIPYK